MKKPSTSDIRKTLPYGKWTCEDGREVLFNREYVPIWQKTNGVVSRADRNEWVPFVKQEWFYTDNNPPYTWGSRRASKNTRKFCEDILIDWGLEN